jgi:Taurine catabolism dioxygenase TauD, TfdA family
MKTATTPAYASPFTQLGAWTSDSLRHSSDWVYHFRPETLVEIDAMLRRHTEQPGGAAPGDHWVLPSFEADLDRLRNGLRTGLGFVLLKGLPSDRYSEEEAASIYWGLGTLLGTPLPQNARGDLLYSVRDEGYVIARDYGTIGVRFSKTHEPLNFHTDAAPAWRGITPNAVGLLALRTARSGGASVLVSGQAVHNVMLEERPDCLQRLYEPYYFDRRAEIQPGEPAILPAPVFSFDGSLGVRYFRHYINEGHALLGIPLQGADLEALDVLESVMARPELQFAFEMEPGDIQFVNNFFVLHSRTAYEDYPERERKRHLKRIWINFN